MKIRLCLLLALAVPLFAEDVKVGDTRETVIKKLGRPIGQMALGGKEMLSYERGYVEIQDGKASLVRIVTAEKAEADRRAREEAARDAEADYRERVAKAEEAKASLLSDESFKTNSAAEKIAQWDELKRSYPEATTPDVYNNAVAEQQRQNAEDAERDALAVKAEKPKPRLSSSKRRRYIRAHDTNRVDFGEQEEESP